MLMDFGGEMRIKGGMKKFAKKLSLVNFRRLGESREDYNF
jgi:hypothetical protein